MTTARLTAILEANSAKFEEGIKRAEKSLLSFGNVFKVTLQSAAIRKALDTIGEGLKGMTIGAAENIDKTAKAARSLGENIRQFQAQSLVAREAGVSQEAYATAVAKSGKALVDATRGSKEQSRAFAALKLDTAELLKLSPGQRFEEIAVALSKIENPTQRTTLALQLFGKAGLAVVPMLEDFRAKAEEARAFNDKFNISLSQIDARNVEEANDTMGRVRQAAEGLGNTIAVRLSPLVTELGNQLLNAGVDGKTFGDAVTASMNTVAAVVDVARIGFTGLRLVISDMTLAVAKFMVDANYQIFEFAKSMQAAGGAFAPLGEKIEGAMRAAAVPMQTWALGVKAANDELHKQADEFEFVYDKIQKIQADADARARAAESKGLGGGKGGLFDPDAIEAGTGKIGKLSDALKKAEKDAGQMGDAMAGAFERLSNAVMDGTFSLKMLGQEAIKIFSTLLRNQAGGDVFSGTINNFGGALGSGIGSLFSGFGNLISGFLPSFDAGTNYVQRSGLAMIHEGEAIVPAQANRGWSGGGPMVNVTVVTPPGAQVTEQTEQRNSAGGVDMRVVIEDMVAGVLSDPRSKPSRTLRNNFGVTPQLRNR